MPARTYQYSSDGRLFAYDKTYDRVTTKTERPLQLVDRIKYNTTTSDDPVMQEVNSFLVNCRVFTQRISHSWQQKKQLLSTPQTSF